MVAADREPDPLKVSPGRVLTGPGIEIVTERPRLTVPARMMGMGLTSNPVAELTFDHDGKVTEVTWLSSTGMENLDAPLTASLYQWRARGEVVDEMRPGERFTQRVELLLVREGR